LNKPTITATFHPQAWINDHAVPADPEGPTKFDATERVLELLTMTLADDDYRSDEIRAAGPDWVKNWHGPFYIEVCENIETYFEKMAEYVNYLEQKIERANREIERLNRFLPDDNPVRIMYGIDDDDEDDDLADHSADDDYLFDGSDRVDLVEDVDDGREDDE
jgi:hypothetical protein